jgi:hypothetical protein
VSDSAIDREIAASRTRGERVAVATLRSGSGAGARLLVWAAGQSFGDLGWPRLNQRVALYAEQLFDRGVATRLQKSFDLPDAGKVEVEIVFVG